MHIKPRINLFLFVGWLSCILAAATSHGFQTGTETSDLKISVTAYSGQPFGVGVVSLVPQPKQPLTAKFPNPAALQLLGPDAWYPVVERIGAVSSGPDEFDELRIYFLFHAEAAKRLTVLGNEVELQPTVDANGHTELLDRWWHRYSAEARRNQKREHYPAQVDQFLIHMLARRLGFTVSDQSRTLNLDSSAMTDSIGQLTGTSAVRLAMQKASLLGTSRNEIANEPLPKAVSPPAIEIPKPDEGVEVESMAMVVPPELFYARFTRYKDLSWFIERIDEWGTELSGMTTQSALQYDLQRRIQDQLNLYQSELAKHLSDAIIKEIAVIGSDTFLCEGAGIGVLFESRSNELLKTILEEQRNQRRARGKGVTLSTVQLGESKLTASLLSSPDNRVRSFYVSSGDFHLITTSSTIARRFLETCSDMTKSLGASQEFRYARTVTPISRNDTAFIYLSDPFFRTFVDPAFRVEMTRRAASESEIELVQLALLSAKAEHHPHSTLEELLAGGFLPADFLRRADGSRLMLKDGVVIDSLRGARGTFLPVPDVQVEKVTKTEVGGYERFSRDYGRIWTWMDPATLAVQRHVLKNQERLVLDLHMYPYPRREFGWLDMLALKKTQHRLAPIPGVVLTAEANVLGMKPAFVGITDYDHPVVVVDGKVDPSGMRLEDEPWFIGSAPAKGVLGFFTVPNNRDLRTGEIVQFRESPSRNIFEPQYGYKEDDFSAVSPRRFALEPLVGKLKLEDSDREAEVRIHIGDLAHSKIRRLIDAGYWTTAKQITEGHESLLNQMRTQFHVSAEHSVSAVESILQARPVNLLGGEYLPNEDKINTSHSETTLWEFEHPLIKRLRAADFELTTEGTTLIVHTEVLLDVP